MLEHIVRVHPGFNLSAIHEIEAVKSSWKNEYGIFSRLECIIRDNKVSNRAKAYKASNSR
jgi:hypothetical protein